MKVKTLAWAIIGLAVVLLAGLFLYRSRTTNGGNFSLQDYQMYIEEFPSEEIAGPVETEEMAIAVAEHVWTSCYGNRVLFNKPYIVQFDAENGAWLVRGSLPFYRAGGVPYILIVKDSGRILAVWHDK